MSDSGNRILDEDELIPLAETLKILGGMSTATAYTDTQLMALKISMTAEGRRTKSVRFIKREVLALRAQRVERAESNAAKVCAEIEARVEQRRTRQRLQRRAAKKAAGAEA